MNRWFANKFLFCFVDCNDFMSHEDIGAEWNSFIFIVKKAVRIIFVKMKLINLVDWMADGRK